MNARYIYANSKMSHLIDEYVPSERNRAILKRRYIDGITYEKLAEEFQMSVRQVQNIDYKFQQKVLLPHKAEII